MSNYQVIHAEVLEWAREYKERIKRGEAEPFHALLSDPPWHLRGGFMGKYWDHDGPDAVSFKVETWATLADILHPGAFLFVFAGSRGWHRLACAMEDAGLILQPSIFVWGLGVVEVPFCLGWLNSQSFPKASRLDKKLDERAGKLEDRVDLGPGKWADKGHKPGQLYSPGLSENTRQILPATPLARAWEGHRYGGQILKDALSPIVVAQKPWTNPRLDCIVRTGAGSLNVDAGRVAGAIPVTIQGQSSHQGNIYGKDQRHLREFVPNAQGRWPSNFALVHKAPNPDGSGGCVRAGTRRVKGSGWDKAPGNDAPPPSGYHGWDDRLKREGYADPDGMETVTAWRCEPDCPARRLGEMSGSCGAHGGDGGAGAIWGGASAGGKEHGDKGTCARFYHQSGWEHERAEMECRSDCPVAKLDEQAGERPAGVAVRHRSGGKNIFSDQDKPPMPDMTYGDSGGASRFYHNADWEHERAEMQCCQDCPVAKLNEQAGERGAHGGEGGSGAVWGNLDKGGQEHGDGLSGASRFYAQADWSHEIAERLATSDPVSYVPKAAKRERNEGLNDFFWRKDKKSPIGFVRITEEEWETLGEEEKRIKAQTGKRVSLRARGNVHVALKPISLCVWLAKLLAPPKEYAPRRIVIPFCGSGSELIGAIRAGWEEAVAIDFIREYVDIAEARAAFWSGRPVQLELAEEPT